MNPAPRDEHAPYDSDALLRGMLSQSAQNNLPQQIVRIDARAIADPVLGIIEHATLVLERTGGLVRVRFAGETASVPHELTDRNIPQLTLHDQLLMPALCNAHTHLDLTHIGPQPHVPSDGFVRWVDMIRTSRAVEDDQIGDCVRLGIERSLAGGVIAVGDIAGAPAGRLTEIPIRTLARSPLMGVSYLEFFGIGTSAAGAIRRVDAFLRDQYPGLKTALQNAGVRLGLQPHATNTIDLSVYTWVAMTASQLGLPLSTHLAETPEERQFVEDGTGPQRKMLERFGIWEESILDMLGKGKHPIEHLQPALQISPMLVAHVNDATDEGIEILAQTQTSVAYCPRASRYFQAAAHFGPHRYQDMLDAGVNVCLGTDSIVNLDTPHRMSTLDEMRLLWHESRPDPKQLLSMGTINGARAIGLDANRFRLNAGAAPAGVIAVEITNGCPDGRVWGDVMGSKSAPSWVYRDA